ncbi:ADP-ribosylglycohydrolase family protein [Rhodanobacter thiooxydans]|uniref:ADP-ribosylglycohydrolase family protein n=1 Tax=Rhodanobacter thiooxydans TaxID=416169 RepID=UPI000D350309|nr:ADP-ribosylglycohydrolase family protein [Rhodanobacter thiooxydans]
MAQPGSLYIRRDRLAGGLWGLLIGNALGVPYAHHDVEELVAIETIDFEPPAGFDRSYVDVPPRTWTMQGAQALCLLHALLLHEQFGLDDLTERVIGWAEMGLYSVDSCKPANDPDMAGMVQSLLNAPSGHVSHDAVRTDDRSALIRMLPLVLCHLGSEAELVAKAIQLSSTKTAHRFAKTVSVMYALWARAELDAIPAPWTYAAARLRELGPTAGLAMTDIEQVLDLEHGGYASGSSDVIDSLWSARVAMNETNSYADAVRRAITFGGDTDITAAVTGGLAGLRYGMYGIPDMWREQLRGKEKIDDRLVVLLIHATPRQAPWISKARSSRTDPLRIGTIHLVGGGKIGITFCPGKKQPFAETGAWNRDLDTDLEAVRAWGATHLVTLIAPWEFVELDVVALPKRAKAHGLIWHHAPILDGHAPDILPKDFKQEEWFEGKWPVILPQLHEALDRGEGVVVHCKGGLGRAGTVAALLLASRDPALPFDEVVEHVREARPNAIETVVQERYLATHLSG